MGQPQILTRGARTAGSILCAVLAVVSLGWIIRDLTEAGGIESFWWMWAGLSPAYDSGGVGFTALNDLVLLVMYAVVAVKAPRSPSAAASLMAVGVVTVVLRAPALVPLTRGVERFSTEDVRAQALLTVVCAVLSGLALIVAVLTGRRPQGYDGYGYPPAPAGDEPARPARGPAVVVFVALGAAAAAILAWQGYYLSMFGWTEYRIRMFDLTVTGRSLFFAPTGWLAVGVAGIALVAAGAAIARATFSRALGMAAAALLLADSALKLSIEIRLGAYGSFARDSLPVQLNSVTTVGTLVLSLVVFALLIRRGDLRDTGPMYETSPADRPWGQDPYGPPPRW